MQMFGLKITQKSKVERRRKFTWKALVIISS